MIIDLPDTTSAEISRALQRIHEESSQTTGRVLTLIVNAKKDDDLDAITTITTGASKEHPSRVIVLVDNGWAPRPRVDAQLAYGGSTGASELVVIHLRGEVAKHRASVVTPLLLPDTPIVAWWPSTAPLEPVSDSIGAIAQRRITDVRRDPVITTVSDLVAGYHPGDTDTAWARITQWRGIVASALDVYPRESVHSVDLYGMPQNPSVDLAAGWLSHRLQVPVVRRPMTTNVPDYPARTVLVLHRASGDTVLAAHDDDTVSVSIPNHPRSSVALGRRSRTDCLAEELRHLDPDTAYAGALSGLNSVTWENR